MKMILFAVIVVILASCCNDTNKIDIGFYNVENLFDLEDDPLKNDDEFAQNNGPASQLVTGMHYSSLSLITAIESNDVC